MFVEDVAAAFERSLEDVESFGKSYDLCGPRVYTLRELVEMRKRNYGRRRLIVGLNDAMSYAQASTMEPSVQADIARARHADDARQLLLDEGGQRLPLRISVRHRAYGAGSAVAARSESPRARYQELRERASRNSRR